MIKVKISGVKMISGYTKEQASTIKEDLTFDNPDYLSAQQHSKFGTGKIPPYITYYTEGKGGMIIPRGYSIPFPHKIVEDNRFLNKGVKYPKLHIKLRGTQEEAVEDFLHYVEKEQDERGVIILPTGKGKSVLGIYLARKFAQKALIVVQKDDLVDGWTKDAKFVLGIKPKEVGLIKEGDFRIGKHLTVTTIQTLSKLPANEIRKLHNIFGMVIVDEFHHSVARIYSLLEYFPARFKIGLTATAMRNDGLVKVLNLLFGQVAYEYKDVATDEDILPVSVKIRNTSVVFEPERVYKYNKRKKRPEPVKIPISDVRKAISFDEGFNSQLVNDIVTEYNKKKSCIVFTHEKEHCRIIQEKLLERGIPERRTQLYYGDSKEKKDVMKTRAEKREVLITIATFAIATEGTNVKAWERAFLASTVANEKDTVQAIGRIRRTDKGKADCIVYDYRFPSVIMAKNHGKVRDKVYKERGYATEGKEVKKRKPTGRGFGLFRETGRRKM